LAVPLAGGKAARPVAQTAAGRARPGLATRCPAPRPLSSRFAGRTLWAESSRRAVCVRPRA